MKKYLFLQILFLVFVVSVFPMSNKRPFLEVYADNNGVSHGVLHANGIGKYLARGKTPAQARLMAKRAARVNCYRNLLSAAKGRRVRIRSGLIREDGFLKGAAIYKEEVISKGGIFTRAEMCLFFVLNESLLNKFRNSGIMIKNINKDEYLLRKEQSKLINEKQWMSWTK